MKTLRVVYFPLEQKYSVWTDKAILVKEWFNTREEANAWMKTHIVVGNQIMRTKEYILNTFIPIAKEEAKGFSDVIESLESIEYYLENSDIITMIDEMIKDNQRYFDKAAHGDRIVCWACIEDDYCYHEKKIETLNELKQKILNNKRVLSHPEDSNNEISEPESLK
jgi:predicted protein tyrosine phosphatase